MDLDLLDNPIWHALNSHHRHLALRGDIAVRYAKEIFAVAALPQSNSPGLEDLARLVEVGEITSLFGGSLPENLAGWEVLQDTHLPQMVCEDLKPSTPVDAIELTAEDVPDMRALVALAQPGPFQRRTIEMGYYLGLRKEGQLVAMAGQRMHLTGFCEISAVCTHPDHRGRGYAGALTTMQAEFILARGETPFLHLAPTNDAAMRLYEKLGFRHNKKIRLSILKRLE
ncbi:MAG: GNAT family N-acetyltransferase [Desulfobacterales bacterium]